MAEEFDDFATRELPSLLRNVVATYLAGQPGVPHEVALALEVLASRAHNRIQTGWNEGAVRRQWPEAFDGS